VAENPAEAERLGHFRHPGSHRYRKMSHLRGPDRELPDQDIPSQMLAVAQPKRQYYYQSSMGNRLFELGLGPLGLAFCAATSKKDQILAKKMLAEHGKEGFNAAWLASKGLDWAAEILECLSPSLEVRHV